jgi:hypothetical protein
MKTKLALLLTLVCLSQARATLIDLTPGGFSSYNQPEQFTQFLSLWNQRVFTFFDEARVLSPYHGWVSQYGDLDGGISFQTNLFALDPTQVAEVSWDFTDLAGYSMSRLLIFGVDANGDPWEHLYAVPRKFNISDIGNVTLHEGVNIGSISFFGRTPTSPVPDTGSTLGLFGLGLGAFAFLRKRI